MPKCDDCDEDAAGFDVDEHPETGTSEVIRLWCEDHRLVGHVELV